MVDPATQGHTAEQHEPSTSVGEGAQMERPSRQVVVWAVLSLGFLAVLAFGSVEARIWRFNQLFFENRRILDVWSYQASHLPDVSAQRAVSVLYYASVAILIAGTVLGLRYLLDEADTGAHAPASSPRNDAPHDG